MSHMKRKSEQYMLPKELTTENLITETPRNEKKWNMLSARLG